MSALVLAAVLSVLPPASTSPSTVACGLGQPTQVARTGVAPPLVRKLGDLPRPYLLHAVLRRVGDCGLVDIRENGAWVQRLTGRGAADLRPAAR